MLPPKVTVLMPVYNGERYLREAVDSVLQQTFTSFELLVINDGSRDDSRDIITSLRDERIVLVDNDENLGLIRTLNKGLHLARGEYVARMDCDDLCHPERLARQVTFLDRDPAVAACGTWIRKFGCGKNKICRYHSDERLLRCALLFDSVLAHPTVMLRRQAFQDSGLYYDPAYQHAEDYELWVRVAHGHKIGIIPEVLLDYRLHAAQVSSAFNAGQLESAGRVRRSLILELGLDPSPQELETHQRIGNYLVGRDRDFFTVADNWLCRLKEANDRARVYPEPYFSAVLTERLCTVLKKMIDARVFPKTMPMRPRLFTKTSMGWISAALLFLRQGKGKYG